MLMSDSSVEENWSSQAVGPASLAKTNKVQMGKNGLSTKFSVSFETLTQHSRDEQRKSQRLEAGSTLDRRTHSNCPQKGPPRPWGGFESGGASEALNISVLPNIYDLKLRA